VSLFVFAGFVVVVVLIKIDLSRSRLLVEESYSAVQSEKCPSGSGRRWETRYLGAIFGCNKSLAVRSYKCQMSSHICLSEPI
jgi:hypothetical protein